MPSPMLCVPANTFSTLSRPLSSASKTSLNRQVDGSITTQKRTFIGGFSQHPLLHAVRSLLQEVPADARPKLIAILAGGAIAVTSILGYVLLHPLNVIQFFLMVYVWRTLRRAYVIPALLRHHRPRLALALDTWGESEMNNSKFWRAMYLMNPFHWVGLLTRRLLPLEQDDLRRMEVYTHACDRLASDPRIRRLIRVEYFLGMMEVPVAGTMGGGDLDGEYHGWVTVPVLESRPTPAERRQQEMFGHFALRKDRMGREFVEQTGDMGAEFIGEHRVMGRVYVYFTKDALRNDPVQRDGQRIQVDFEAMMMGGSNEPYTVTKAEFRSRDAQDQAVLYVAGRVEWEHEVAQREDEKERLRAKRARQMNRSREEGEPEVVDVNDEGGRVIEAEFEEKPSKHK